MVVDVVDKALSTLIFSYHNRIIASTSEIAVGLLVNIESIDGAGKTTQAPMVKRLLVEEGLSVSLFSFPDRPSTCQEAHESHFSTGVLIDRYLSNDSNKIDLINLQDTFFRRDWTWEEDGLSKSFSLASLPVEVREKMIAVIQEKMVQMIFSINRRERASALLAALNSHDVVIVGRYLSAWTYGIDGGVGRLQLTELEGDLPTPDLSFLLDIDPAIARSRREEKSRDRYERDFDKQNRIRALYNEIVRNDFEEAKREGRPPRFIRLDATLDPGEISAQIVAAIRERLNRSPWCRS